MRGSQQALPCKKNLVPFGGMTDMNILKQFSASALALSCFLTLGNGMQENYVTEHQLSPAYYMAEDSYYDFFYSYSPTDYLDVVRGKEAGTLGNLPSSVTGFSQSQAEAFQWMAQNRAVVQQILSQVVPDNATEDEAIRGIYDFLIYNFKRNDTDLEVLPTIKQVPYSSDLVNVEDRGTWLLSDGTGGCLEFSSLLYRLLSSAGIPSFEVYGEYVNRDGSSQFHGFNRALVNGDWYWYDVDVEGSVYRRGDVASPLYYLYKKDSEYWLTNHVWDGESVSAMEADYEKLNLKKSGEIFSYEFPTQITFNGSAFVPQKAIYGYVDKDTMFDTESVMLLPFQELIGFLGGSYTWDGDKGCLVVKRGDQVMEFVIGAQTYSHNGVECLLSLPVQTIQSIDYISVDDVCSLLQYGRNVQFYQNSGTVTQAVLFQSNSGQNGSQVTLPSGGDSLILPTEPETTPEAEQAPESLPSFMPEYVPDSNWDAALEGTSPWSRDLILSLYRLDFLHQVEDFANGYQKNITREEICRLLVNLYESSGKTAPRGDLSFTDTSDDYVNAAYHLGIVTGRSATVFAPEDSLSRQEFAMMILRLAEQYQFPIDVSTELDFVDAETVATWAVGSVYYAQNAGFLAGTNGKFRPMDSLTMEEALVSLYRMTTYFAVG